MSSPASGQSAGLSTAENSSMDESKPASLNITRTRVQGDDCGAPLSIGHDPHTADEPRQLAAPHSPSKRGLFSIASYRRKSTNKSEDGISISQSISNSAPTVLVHTPPTSNDPKRPIRSSMSSRTLHESIHRGQRPRSNSAKTMGRCVSFANVNIREYERILGDNPSVRTGPPLSIGWRHAPEPTVVSIDDYEDGKGAPRSSAEYMVPRSVRESLMRDHAGVSRREMATAIRSVNQAKAQRRKTVVNLNMQKTEERVEGAKRKIKKILKPSLRYETLEEKLWDEAHLVAMEKAKRLEESIRKGESVSMRNVYSVGTPCNNLLPSRRNSTRTLGDSLTGGKPEELVDDTVAGAMPPASAGGHDMTSTSTGSHDIPSASAGEELSLKSMAKQFTPKSTKDQQTSGASATEKPFDHKDSLSGKGQISSSPKRGSQRTSASIVASESESEEIFANLVLDDAGH